MEHFLGVDFTNLSEVRRRLAISAFYCQLLCVQISFSQRVATSFGQLTDVHLGFLPIGVTVGKGQTGKTEIALLASQQPAIHFYEIGSNGKPAHFVSLRTQSRYRFITSADLNSDGVSEYLALSATGTSLTVLRRPPGASLAFEEYSIALAAPAERCAGADLNNDKRPDVLLYGKTSSGTHVLLGQTDGTFKSGPVLFPDVSASDLTVTDVNADGVADVLLVNWLNDQLIVYYGIGRCVYTEQVAVQLDVEPSELAMTKMTARGTFFLAITSAETKQVQVFSGNSLGDYRRLVALQLENKPSGIAFAHFRDGDPSIVTASVGGIAVFSSRAGGWTMHPTYFGAARSISGWTLSDLDDDGNIDCVVLDQASRRLVVLFNDASSGRVTFEYAVGISPRGLVVGDLEGNGKLDIGVVNAESANISILTNVGKGKFSGQIAVHLPVNPTNGVVYTSSRRQERVIMVSHAEDDRVTALTFTGDSLIPKSVTLPTGAEPEVLLARMDKNRLRFLVRYRNPRDKSYLLSSFEQINQRQFVEKSFRSTFPARVIALNVAEVAGGIELLFATNDRRTTAISQALSDNSFEFTSARPYFSLPDSGAAARWLFSAYVNNDTVRDVLVAFGPPRNALAVRFAGLGSAGKDSVEWLENIHPVGEDAIVIEDLNNDRIVDIAWLDTVRSAVMAIYGNETRPFRSPVVVANAPGVSSMRIAPLRSIDELDLVMAYRERGTVSVILDPFSK